MISLPYLKQRYLKHLLRKITKEVHFIALIRILCVHRFLLSSMITNNEFKIFNASTSNIELQISFLPPWSTTQSKRLDSIRPSKQN